MWGSGGVGLSQISYNIWGFLDVCKSHSQNNICRKNNANPVNTFSNLCNLYTHTIFSFAYYRGSEMWTDLKKKDICALTSQTVLSSKLAAYCLNSLHYSYYLIPSAHPQGWTYFGSHICAPSVPLIQCNVICLNFFVMYFLHVFNSADTVTAYPTGRKGTNPFDSFDKAFFQSPLCHMSPARFSAFHFLWSIFI